MTSKDEKSHVIYLGHIPEGMFERQLYEYFTQFGEIAKLKLARSKKTGVPKGYAFIEFVYPEVAEIAADTMNGYLIGNHVLRCHMVKRDVDYVFKNWTKRKFVKSRRMKHREYNKLKTISSIVKIKHRQSRKLNKKLKLMNRLVDKPISKLELHCLVNN